MKVIRSWRSSLFLTADRRGSRRRIFIVAAAAVAARERNQTFRPIKCDATNTRE